MGSYSQVFGGNTIDPTQLSYVAYTITEDLTLTWPIEATSDSDVAAAKIDITASVNSLSVFCPPADQTSVGQDILFRNPGLHTFTVKDSGGTVIGSVASGEAWYFYVTDNATPAGAWVTIEFGTGVSDAVAASLAGAGLRANANALDQDLITTSLAANYTVTSSDRATVLQSTGGALTWSFTAAATLGNGFFVYVINAGSGSITLDPNGAETIDGSATKSIAPTETLMVFSDGTNLHSLGYGRSLVTTVTGTSISLAGTGTYTLATGEVAAQVQDYSGILTGNRITDYGSGVGYWFVRNNTSGAFTVTARAGGLDAGVAITQGGYTILRSNGTNMQIAFSDAGGTVTSVGGSSDFTGVPITTTGTLGLSNTGVAAGSYGAASKTLTATVDAKGRLSVLADTPILITASQISDFLAAIEPVGTYKWTADTTYGTGYLLCDAKTLGNASSNGTARANADTSALFTVLWTRYSDTILPIYTSAGVLSTRGASAAIDFAANKAITLPDLRGRVMAMLDGVAGRLTATTMTPNGNTLGATGGQQVNNATTSINSNGTNAINFGNVAFVQTFGGILVASSNAQAGVSQPNLATVNDAVQVNGYTSIAGNFGISVSGTGTSSNFSIVQPTWLANCFIKYA